jgi:transcriptional regulator GlxA family with amidase domain
MRCSIRTGEDPAMEERLSSLTQIAYDQSWQWTSRGAPSPGLTWGMRDYRIRKALRLMQEGAGESNEVDAVAREVGLSRPHFYKLFREQVGVTPKLYLNTLLMERAIERLADGTKPVADIGFDLGFSGQASFSRFFISNGVVPPERLPAQRAGRLKPADCRRAAGSKTPPAVISRAADAFATFGEPIRLSGMPPRPPGG